MAHLKRQKAPKNWPIHRKGTKYIIRPSFNLTKGVPILIAIRDMLKFAQNRKEVKKAIHEKNILLNKKPVRDEKNSVLLFDTLTIKPSKQSFRLELTDKGKFDLKEIKETEADNKVAKIVDKKILKGKKTQLNLSDGRNSLSEIKCKVNDSVLINLTSRKIEKCLPLTEKAKVMVFAGKHTGETGIIDKLKTERKMAKLKANGKEINVLIKQLMVVE